MKVFSGQNLDENHINFNRHIRGVRQIVERVIGILKIRFRCILSERSLRYMPTKASRIIYSCAILHNYLIHKKFNILYGINENEIENEIANPMNINENDSLDWGTERRDELLEFLNEI